MDGLQLATYFNLALLKTLREGLKEGDGDEGEGKFGFIPLSQDPNSSLSASSKKTLNTDQIQLHPLLGKSAQFSGIDKHLTADPVSNEKAQEQYPQLRLQRQLRHQNQPGQSRQPRLKR